MSVLWQFAARFALYLALFLSAALPQAAAASEAGFSEVDGLEIPAGPPQKEALLSILYDASTYGELHPCPT